VQHLFTETVLNIELFPFLQHAIGLLKIPEEALNGNRRIKFWLKWMT